METILSYVMVDFEDVAVTLLPPLPASCNSVHCGTKSSIPG
jgi:hypothetical protein